MTRPLLFYMAAATVHWMWAAGVNNNMLMGGGVCKTVGGLTRSQQEVCLKYPEVTAAALVGLQQAVRECQFQFRWHRWNCSNLSNKSQNPHTSIILKKGYRESAFASAISAAGVAHSVARACSQGRLLECGCEPSRHRATAATVAAAAAAAVAATSAASQATIGRQGHQHQQVATRNTWKWGGCSHNLEFGLHFSTNFLDAREKNNGDIHSRIVLHNNEAGRQAVASNMEVRCKCHGVSGSCELKTCWRAAPDFRVVGAALKDRFREAVMVEESNLGTGTAPLLIVQEGRRGGGRRQDKKKTGRKKRKKKKRRRRRPKELANSLIYYEKSPNFCERDAALEVSGTVGRQCRRTGRGVDSCASLCCGRGYNIVRRRRTDRCNCKFQWCCYVTCANCTVDEWITVCK